MTKRMLSEAQAYDLLSRYGVTVPRHEVAVNEEGALKAAKKIGFPVVMKIMSPQVIHKSDVGGVITDINSEREAGESYIKIVNSVKRANPEAEIKGVIVEKQMATGLELIIGGKTDSSFGKVISFGIGGKLVELLDDIALRVLPIDKNEVEKMIREIKAYPLIRGYRGEPPLDEKVLVRTIEGLSKLFYQKRELVEFDINPLILYEKGACGVDARLIVSDEPIADEEGKKSTQGSTIMSTYPDSIAVIGASSNPNKVGYSVIRNLHSFMGRVYPVNPHENRIMGLKTYPSLSAIKGKIDLAIITVPAEIVPQVIEEAGRKGIKFAVVISAGFRETGEKGKLLEDELVRIAQKYNMRMLGPNCLGIMLPRKGINATFDPTNPRPGRIAFISQSGAVITTVVDWSIPEEVGFSSIVSVGNQADLGFVDFLRFAERDKETKAAILYIEEIKEGKEFMRIAKKVSAKKPIIALKSGSSERGQKAASSHTGSLAGSYKVYTAAFRQAGIAAAHSLKEAFQMAELLASETYPGGKRAVIITNAGGFAVLSSDYAEEYGIDLVELPEEVLDELNSFLPEDWSHENPMDLIGDAGADRYARVFDVMTRTHYHCDIVFIVSVPTAVLDPGQLAKEIVRFSRGCPKVIVCCMLGGDSVKSGIRALRDAHIPNFSELEDAFRVVGKILRP